MSNLKTYGKKILTLEAIAPFIQHTEQFRDSRRGNRALMQRMRWLKNLNNHNNGVWFANGMEFHTLPEFKRNRLKVTILHN